MARIMEVMAESDPELSRPTWGRRVLDELRFLVGLGVTMTALLTLVWGHYKIPSESMQPALEVGDHIYVSKFAYGYSRHSLPFSLHNLPLPEGRILTRLPERGDIVVFRNPNNGIVMIKRAIGLPGDEVQVVGGRLHINGQAVPRIEQGQLLYRAHDTFRSVMQATAYAETLPGRDPHTIWEMGDDAVLDDTDVYVVPQGHVFFMGDNRERSTDSRLSTQNPDGTAIFPASAYGPGFVPVENLIGRADLRLFSFNRCNRGEDLRCPDKGRALSRL